MTAASQEERKHTGPASKTDAPTQGFVDTIKRRQASPPETQREADIRQAEEEGTWTPTEKDATRDKSQAKPEDSTGINPHGVVDETMQPLPRA